MYLDVGPKSDLSGTVNGKRCTVTVDSGSTDSFIFSLAKKLGLLSGKERSETVTVYLWYAKKTVRLRLLDDVTIILEGKVTVRTPLSVMPKTTEKYYVPFHERLVLGVPELCRGRVVQTFSEGRSSLYIRCPEALATKCKERSFSQIRDHICSFFVRWLPDKKRLMEVVVDTGVPGFYVNQRTNKNIILHLEKQAMTRVSPFRRVSLDLGGGKCLEAEPLEATPHDHAEDFFMGRALLHKYEALLNYSRGSVSFRVGNRRLRVKMGVE